MIKRKQETGQGRNFREKPILMIYMLLMSAGLASSYWWKGIRYSDPEFLSAIGPWIFLLAVFVVTIQVYYSDVLNLWWETPPRYGVYFIVAVPTGIMAFYAAYKCFPALSFLHFLIPLLVGIAEEGMYRGILLRRFLQRKDCSKAVLLSAICFAGLHLLNLLAGQSVSDIAVQLILTFFSGLYFGAVYIRVKKLSLLVLQHGLWDFITFSGIMEQSSWTGIAIGILTIVQMLIAAVLLLFYHREQRVSEI